MELFFRFGGRRLQCYAVQAGCALVVVMALLLFEPPLVADEARVLGYGDNADKEGAANNEENMESNMDPPAFPLRLSLVNLCWPSFKMLLVWPKSPCRTSLPATFAETVVP